MDLVVGPRHGSGSVLLTMTERKGRAERIVKLERGTQVEVVAALDRLESRMGRKRFNEMFKSITLDNGSEFLDQAGLERSRQRRHKRRTTVYYAHPCSAWERGTNENMNRMIRRFIPKGADIGKYSKKEIRRIQDWLNNYPRKILDYRTSAEVMGWVM